MDDEVRSRITADVVEVTDQAKARANDVHGVNVTRVLSVGTTFAEVV